MEWPPTASTERKVNMGENGTIGWPENRLLVREFGAQPCLLNPPLNGEVSAFDLRVQP